MIWIKPKEEYLPDNNDLVVVEHTRGTFHICVFKELKNKSFGSSDLFIIVEDLDSFDWSYYIDDSKNWAKESKNFNSSCIDHWVHYFQIQPERSKREHLVCCKIVHDQETYKSQIEKFGSNISAGSEKILNESKMRCSELHGNMERDK